MSYSTINSVKVNNNAHMLLLRPLKVPSRLAMSLIEVFMGLSVLSLGILGSMSVMATVNDYRRSTEEHSIGYATADLIAQRLRVSIGGSLAPWQEHRRATPVSGEAMASPLTEADLITANILTEKVGLQNAEIYIEYYSDQLISTLAQIMEDTPSINARSLWFSAVGNPGSDKSANQNNGPTLIVDGVEISNLDPPVILPRSKADIEKLLSSSNSRPLSIIIRVLVSWRPPNGSDNTRQWAEATVAYRP